MPDKYLARYASPEIALADLVQHDYDHVVVVPAFNETIALVDGIQTAVGSDRVLCILVVNATSRASDEIRATNARLVDDAGAIAATGDGLDVLTVDRSSSNNELPDDQGVGMARKIGCDIALALHHAGRVASPWIHTTDADVRLPADYFTAAQPLANEAAALTYPFWHDADPSTREGRALSLYEVSLRYYVAGLRWAASDYAFHTVGSTLAVDATAYAKVRGVPLRQAGEDFYLLSKLAKLGDIRTPNSKPIRIRQRSSDRVPFGTGPATTRIAATLEDGHDFTVYHPGAFLLLRRTLQVARAAVLAGTTCKVTDVSGSAALAAAWSRTKLQAAISDVGANATTAQARARRFRDWFDGFRTLAFIHAARDGGLSNPPWQEAFAQAPFVPDAQADLVGFRQRLLYLEQGRE